MSNGDLYLGGAVDRILDALYDIWGVAPAREQGSYVFAPSPNPIVTPATAGSSATGTVTVSPSGAFVLTAHSLYVTDTGSSAARTVYFNWKSSSSDRQFTNDDNGGHAECIGGTDERPFLYPKPYLFDTSTVITIRITTITAAIRWAYVSLIGYRVWNVRALNLTRRSA